MLRLSFAHSRLPVPTLTPSSPPSALPVEPTVLFVQLRPALLRWQLPEDLHTVALSPDAAVTRACLRQSQLSLAGAHTAAVLPVAASEMAHPLAWATVADDGAVLSVHCEPTRRRQGLAATALSAALAAVGSATGSGHVETTPYALVPAEDRAARALFVALGFEPVAEGVSVTLALA